MLHSVSETDLRVCPRVLCLSDSLWGLVILGRVAGHGDGAQAIVGLLAWMLLVRVGAMHHLRVRVHVGGIHCARWEGERKNKRGGGREEGNRKRRQEKKKKRRELEERRKGIVGGKCGAELSLFFFF